MFKSIHLQNFQGHRDTLLELSPGVNVIAGPSNVGKSSIIRALWWVCRNRPMGAGDNYRHRDAGKKEPTSVEIVLDKATVRRFKRGSHNGYAIGEEELVAIRTDVPNEVSGLLDMGDHNLQLQHQSYFLVGDSAGEVALKLNEVAGLDLIDGCLKNTGLLVTRCQADTRTAEGRVAELDNDIAAYNDIAEKDEAVTGLETMAEDLEELDGEIGFLSSTIDTLETAAARGAELEAILAMEPQVVALEAMVADLDELDEEIEFLSKAVDQGTRFNRGIERLEGEIKSMEAEFHTLLKDGGVCPLCKQEIK